MCFILLLEIKYFVSSKNKYLLFWKRAQYTRRDGVGGEAGWGVRQGGSQVLQHFEEGLIIKRGSDRFRIYFLGGI